MKGDLTATGSANAIMTLDGRESSGRAHEIRYVDAQRLITYAAPPAGYVAPPVRPGGNVVAPTPQLTLPQGTITAGSRIEMKLAKEGSKLEGLDAWTNVTMLQKTAQGSRTATGGATLTYDPGKQQFEMTAGTGTCDTSGAGFDGALGSSGSRGPRVAGRWASATTALRSASTSSFSSPSRVIDSRDR